MRISINNNIQNPDDFLRNLEKTPVSCKDVTFKIFGLSLWLHLTQFYLF